MIAPRRPPVALLALLAPATLLAIALLLLNDHVLKAQVGGWWTGKLSDVAGLAFFPLLAPAAAEAIGLRGGARAVAIAAALTGAGFAAIKLSAPAGEAYRVGLAALQWPMHALGVLAAGGGGDLPGLGRVHLTADPTDLLALPALLVAVFQARRLEARADHPR